MNTKFGLDKHRAAAGLEKYRPVRLFEPQKALSLMERAAQFDPSLVKVVRHLSESEAQRFPTWQTLMNASIRAGHQTRKQAILPHLCFFPLRTLRPPAHTLPRSVFLQENTEDAENTRGEGIHGYLIYLSLGAFPSAISVPSCSMASRHHDVYGQAYCHSFAALLAFIHAHHCHPGA